MDDLLRAVRRLIKALLGGWLKLLLRRCRDRKRRKRELREDGWGRRGGARAKCVPVPKRTYRKPDPMIYSQKYLMSQGIAVTWNNPDITLFHNGVAVDSHQLQPATEYEIRARVWNGSTEAPAVDLPVEFTFRDFGVGTGLQVIGTAEVDLPVNGAPGHPAIASVPWRTPAEPGHYCLLATLVWPDDANPHNNVGQENTDVKAPASPADFEFTVRNEARKRRTIRLEADAYDLPEPPPCKERPRRDKERDVPRRWQDEDSWRRARRKEREARLRALAETHDRKLFPVPDGWTVDIQAEELGLDAGESKRVAVAIEPPDGWTGRQPINVNAFAGEDFVGGVTLVVEKAS
jgi:hypothetical protein